jgi:hypothetical protein
MLTLLDVLVVTGRYASIRWVQARASRVKDGSPVIVF